MDNVVGIKVSPNNYIITHTHTHTLVVIFVLHVKAERFVTKWEALLKKRPHIFTYFTTMPIKNEKRTKNCQLFPGRQNFVAGTHMNMYVSVYTLCTRWCCTYSKDLFYYFFHISSYIVVVVYTTALFMERKHNGICCLRGPTLV